MNIEEIMYEVHELGLREDLFTEMKNLETENPYKYKDYKLLIETAYTNIKKNNNESIQK
jgi:hypothetical protein